MSEQPLDPPSGSPRSLKSLAVHGPKIKLASHNYAVTSPIYQSVKFSTQTLSELEEVINGAEGFFYSRYSNPTVRELELLLAKIQGREDAFALASGISTLACCLFSLLKAGDHVVMFVDSYKATRYLVTQLLAKFGVECSLLSLQELPENKGIIPGKTKLIIFESPTNPMTFLPDIEKIVQAAQREGVLTLLDNTFAGFHNHGQFPIDLFVHSLTKFASGHGDVMGGVVIGSKEIIGKMRKDFREMGATLDPHAAYLIARGMKTYFLRFEAQCQNALKVASWLEEHPKIERLLYPGLPSHPQFALAQKQMKDFGSIIAFDLVHTDHTHPKERVHSFIDRLKMIKLAASLGSAETLIAPVDLFYGADLNEEQKKKAGISRTTIRMAIGIEDAEDIIQDLAQSLNQLP